MGRSPRYLFIAALVCVGLLSGCGLGKATGRVVMSVPKTVWQEAKEIRSDRRAERRERRAARRAERRARRMEARELRAVEAGRYTQARARRGQPTMRWDHRPEAASWTRTTMSALGSHGSALPDMQPRDIDQYCPGYRNASRKEREAFWAGLISGLAKYESTWRPYAIGGGDKWYGLTQISPATARGYGCRAKSGRALLDGERNLSCTVRIMAVTVPRDGVIARRDDRWRGVAADWTPFRNREMRNEIASWTRRQSYCRR